MGKGGLSHHVAFDTVVLRVDTFGDAVVG